jgi:hypothetical protein
MGRARVCVDADSRNLSVHHKRGGAKRTAADRLGPFSLPYLPVALFLMPLVMHAAMLPAASALGGLQWQDWLTPGADGLYHAPQARGWGVLRPAELAVRIGVNAIAGLIVVSMLALFEEIGWRG